MSFGLPRYAGKGIIIEETKQYRTKSSEKPGEMKMEQYKIWKMHYLKEDEKELYLICDSEQKAKELREALNTYYKDKGYIYVIEGRGIYL